MKTMTLPTFLALGLFAFASTASAQGMMGAPWGAAGGQGQENSALTPVLAEIYQAQGVSAQNDLDCTKVSDSQFETLGDAYMEVIHPGAAHEYMDQMMGGEGSASLQQAHIAMGRAYLGCWSDYAGAPLTMPMMGGYWGNTMMGGWSGSSWSMPMMGGYGGGFGFGGLGTLTGIVWLVAGILLILVLIRRLGKRPEHHE